MFEEKKSNNNSCAYSGACRRLKFCSPCAYMRIYAPEVLTLKIYNWTCFFEFLSFFRSQLYKINKFQSKFNQNSGVSTKISGNGKCMFPFFHFLNFPEMPKTTLKWIEIKKLRDFLTFLRTSQSHFSFSQIDFEQATFFVLCEWWLVLNAISRSKKKIS